MPSRAFSARWRNNRLSIAPVSVSQTVNVDGITPVGTGNSRAHGAADLTRAAACTVVAAPGRGAGDDHAECALRWPSTVQPPRSEEIPMAVLIAAHDVAVAVGALLVLTAAVSVVGILIVPARSPVG